MKTRYLIAPALIAFLINQGCVSDGDEVSQMELLSGSCPAPVRTCEACSGGLYRTKTVTWLLTHSPAGWECTSTITYGSCQPTCAL